MNGGRSDASTSTDDVKGRPLCLFYFTHPFGVLSPEPPTLAAAPPHVARAFLNMEPVSPFFWTSSATATATATASATDDSYRTTTESSLNYDIGNTTVHANPVSVVSLTRTRKCTVEFPGCGRRRRDSLSSSLFSDTWFTSSGGGGGGSRSPEYPRRVLPYHRTLPPLPLRLPSPPAVGDSAAEDDVWPRKCLHPEKFSLPPIEMPTPAEEEAGAVRVRIVRALDDGGSSASVESVSVLELRGRRRLGVRKLRQRRRRGLDVRRMVTCLMRRAVRGGGECSPSPSPALQRVLRTIRDAWAEPRSLWERCRALSRTYERTCLDGLQWARDRDAGRHRNRAALASCAMQARAQLGEPPRPDASPGLLRRRYSVPETIMRKYRLAQQRSDSEESGAVTHQSAASACPSPPREASCSPCDAPHRFMRRDRELMRKSALLRRMWARPCRAPSCSCCGEEARETRSLEGSRSELRLPSRRSPAPRPAPWASPKRQRLETPDRGVAADLSDYTFRSHRVDRDLSYADTTTDAFSDSEASRLGCGEPPSSERLSEPATAEPESEERSPPESEAARDLSYCDSDSFSASATTAKETNDSEAPAPRRGPISSHGHIEGRVSERSAGADNDDRNVLPYERSLAFSIAAPAPHFEMLEIVVSEVSDAAALHGPVSAAGPLGKHGHNMNIDEYVSNILVESLNSLTDQLECMNASIGGDRKISIVEKEIKVKLQNTGVNTIVHLSPTSNNQIIFGNEELCNEPRDECNNPLSVRDERAASAESNNNLTSSAGTVAATAAFEPPLQSDNVNRAVLQQIQKLFRDELRSLDEGEYSADAVPGVSQVQVSNVDAFMAVHGAAHGRLEIATRAEADLIGGVGAGNYFHDGDDAVVVPRFSAFPHTESMEVNTSSSDDGEALRSDCTSLVDSLDDPNSPRGVLLRRRGELARSTVDVHELVPERARAPDPRPEAFFIRIEDDDRARDEENVRVAEYMPEKIKQRLYRRHRKRELRMECARRSKVKQLKKELERRRSEELARARRELERDCLAILGALIDDVIAKVAQDEYKYMRIKHRNGRLASAKSEENLAKRNRRKDLESLEDRDTGINAKSSVSRFTSDKENRTSERHQVRGKLLARPSVASSDRPPRRIYQKSEIHEGEKCIEILEILEYVNGSPSSPETTNSDENHNQNSRCKKSRIPIPVYERMQRTSKSDVQMRLTGGDGRRASPPLSGHLFADMLLQALVDDPRHTAPAAAPTDARERSNSLRFKRVFDIIPEERSSLSFDSSAEDAEYARRASAPEAVPPLASLPPPAESPRCKDTRSAGTSPLAAAAEEEQARRLRSQTTMTSPCSKSAATSPLRPPTPARPQRPAREGYRERAPEPAADERLDRDRAAAPPAPLPPRIRDRASPALPSAPRTISESRGQRASASDAHEPRRSFGETEPACLGRGRGRGRGRGSVEDGAGGSSSDSGDSGGSLLCSLAPRWLSGQARQRRRARRPVPSAPAASPPPPPPLTDRGPGPGSGAWSVTVAGSCRAALPADVEMRLRFPHDPAHAPAAPQPCAVRPASYQECSCVQCAACAGAGTRAALPPAPSAPPGSAHDPRLTLTLKKEAQDSSILASKSVRKSSAHLPELETYRASRTKLKSSVKTRRGYSLHCWLPDDEPAPIRANNGLSVLGCAIIPELKPRVPTMSERDLTRVYTPRHYLRS